MNPTLVYWGRRKAYEGMQIFLYQTQENLNKNHWSKTLWRRINAMGNQASLLHPTPIIFKGKCIFNYLKCYYPLPLLFTHDITECSENIFCLMCSFEFQYCQETASGRSCCCLLGLCLHLEGQNAGRWEVCFSFLDTVNSLDGKAEVEL